MQQKIQISIMYDSHYRYYNMYYVDTKHFNNYRYLYYKLSYNLTKIDCIYNIIIVFIYYINLGHVPIRNNDFIIAYYIVCLYSI